MGFNFYLYGNMKRFLYREKEKLERLSSIVPWEGIAGGLAGGIAKFTFYPLVCIV